MSKTLDVARESDFHESFISKKVVENIWQRSGEICENNELHIPLALIFVSEKRQRTKSC